MSVSECAHSKLFSASSQMGSLLSRLQHAVIVLDYRVASTDVKVRVCKEGKSGRDDGGSGFQFMV